MKAFLSLSYIGQGRPLVRSPVGDTWTGETRTESGRGGGTGDERSGDFNCKVVFDCRSDVVIKAFYSSFNPEVKNENIKHGERVIVSLLMWSY